MAAAKISNYATWLASLQDAAGSVDLTTDAELTDLADNFTMTQHITAHDALCLVEQQVRHARRVFALARP